MKRIKYWLICSFWAFLVLPAITVSSAGAFTIDSTRDCDANAVIRCGARSFKELRDRYGRTGVGDIYTHFGITQQMINNINADNTVEGTVTKDGRVIVNGKVVAINAMTTGRQNMTGSTKMQNGKTTFYLRPPSASFNRNSLPAYVVMDNNGRFSYAIIASCGNPVIATPVRNTTTSTNTTTKPTTNTSSTSTAAASVSSPQTVRPQPVTNTNTNTNTNNNTVSVSLPANDTKDMTTTEEEAPATSYNTYTPNTTYTPPTSDNNLKSSTNTLPNTGAPLIVQAVWWSSLTGVISGAGHYLYNRHRLFN